MIFGFTDYPILEFGDDKFKTAPIRECEILSYDGNKYCKVKVEDNDSDRSIVTTIKIGYLYKNYGRFMEVPSYKPSDLEVLSKTGDK